MEEIWEGDVWPVAGGCEAACLLGTSPEQRKRSMPSAVRGPEASAGLRFPPLWETSAWCVMCGVWCVLCCVVLCRLCGVVCVVCDVCCVVLCCAVLCCVVLCCVVLCCVESCCVVLCCVVCVVCVVFCVSSFLPSFAPALCYSKRGPTI